MCIYHYLYNILVTICYFVDFTIILYITNVKVINNY